MSTGNSPQSGDEPAPFHYDPYSLEAMRDPLPLYERLRDDYPAYYLPQYDAWAISRFSDVWDGFLDRDHFSEAEGQIIPLERMLVHNGGVAPTASTTPLAPFPLLDPPVHTLVRQVLAPPFVKGAVQRLRPLIEQLAAERLDHLLSAGSFDLNADFASWVAAAVICELVGLPLAQAGELSRLVEVSNARDPGRPGPTPAGQEALGAIIGMLMGVAARRRAGVGEAAQPVDALLRRGVDGRVPDDLEIAQAMISIVIGGIETVPKILAGGIRELARDRSQHDAVMADLEANVPLAVEEMLRLHAPAQWFARTVRQERTLAGVPLKVGQRVILLVASANRDPRQFESADSFLWNRQIRRMISFGIGAHFCIGIHVARLELQVLVRMLLARMPRFEVDERAGSWIESEFQIGWRRLPIRIA